MASSPGGVAVRAVCCCIVDCHPTLYYEVLPSHEHRHLAQLASPQFSPHFDSGFKFLLYPLIDGLQKAPNSPIFPEFSSSPWVCFPLLFFIFLLSWSPSPLYLLNTTRNITRQDSQIHTSSFLT